MKMSEKRKDDLYSAISEPIMRERIEIQSTGSRSGEDLDFMLFQLELKIWKEVSKAMNITGN